jgi:hypothetical protein
MKPMIDVYTTGADGSLQLVESVSCVQRARELASGLSNLFPGEYFGCFERTGEGNSSLPHIEDGREWPHLSNLGGSSVVFLA